MSDLVIAEFVKAAARLLVELVRVIAARFRPHTRRKLPRSVSSSNGRRQKRLRKKPARPRLDSRA